MRAGIKIVVHCSRVGCKNHFEAEVPLDDVSARIESGGSVEIRWPVPDLAPGWRDGHRFDPGIYCPEHA